jgi:hypothetical protein
VNVKCSIIPRQFSHNAFVVAHSHKSAAAVRGAGCSLDSNLLPLLLLLLCQCVCERPSKRMWVSLIELSSCTNTNSRKTVRLRVEAAAAAAEHLTQRELARLRHDVTKTDNNDAVDCAEKRHKENFSFFIQHVENWLL